MDRNAILNEMGLGPIWKLRKPVESGESRVESDNQELPTLDSRLSAIEKMDWDELRQSVADCRACGLCKARKQAVLGVGDVQADWLFVGEGPGAEEDERGEPFVGQAGSCSTPCLPPSISSVARMSISPTR